MIRRTTVSRWRWANDDGRAKQTSMWVATEDRPRTAAHPFYMRLHHILEKHDFDEYVERLCGRFYAEEGRPGLPPGR